MKKKSSEVSLQEDVQEKPLRLISYERFTQQILSGNIRPGQFLSQRELMQVTDMPLGAIREMVPRLEAEGLIKTVPNRGLQVCYVDLKLVRNAFQLRLVLEREGIARFTRNVSEIDLSRIEKAHKDIIKRAKSGVIDARLLSDAQAVDRGLHAMMIDSLGNEIISEIYRVNSLRIHLIRLEKTVLTSEGLLPAMLEHLALIEAIKLRDIDKAVDALSSHLDTARLRMLAD
ncbi:GntR family transcriptional regulator [Glaciimonas sp. GG7]